MLGMLTLVFSNPRKKHYMKAGEDLTLDWRPLWERLKALVSDPANPRSPRYLVTLGQALASWFDPRERGAILEELLPLFNTSSLPYTYNVVSALTAMLPTGPALPVEPHSQPSDFLPTFFHLWSLMTRSNAFDACFIDIFSRVARDHLHCTHVPFTEHGVFTREQSHLIFTAILRLTGTPVWEANLPRLSPPVEEDQKTYPHRVARWIVFSLSPLCLQRESSVLANLEGLMESIDTFFHPSNHGIWTSFLAQLTCELTDMFVSRWNREQSGELDVPPERRINDELKKRFVLSLREVTFMGLFAKSSNVENRYYSTLQGLAYLEPDLILPGALQRFYPSLQGLVEVHRTTSSLCGLRMIASIMSKKKGYRCHITALLELALPGIDANDLNKTQHTLNLINSVAYSIPFVPLTHDGDDIYDTSLARNWLQTEMERMEREGLDARLCYDEELSDEEEAIILRSSTAGLREFAAALLGRVFALLENLPDTSHLRTDSPEHNVMTTLPGALTPLFASLSPDLFDMALDKLATFVSSHVVHQARAAMAWICNALCKVNPEKTLKVFIPMLIVNIRNEIDDNGAASDRNSGTEVLPRDRALVWHVSMLSMCVFHVGAEVLRYKDELFGIAEYMQEKCRGLPTINISNYIQHLLLNLTHIYPIDNAHYEPDVIAAGLDVHRWGRPTPPSELTIKWHRPSPAEILFAVELSESQARSAARRLQQLMSDDPPVSRKGKNKEWSDELVRSLKVIKPIISGLATLFDPLRASGEGPGRTVSGGDQIDHEGGALMEEDNDLLVEIADDNELKRQFHFPDGYLLSSEDPVYERIHCLREDIGRLLSQTHAFLNANQQDDVACFTALYAAYSTWIADVGIESSAGPLERLVRSYKAEISPFKIKGLRKVYPRPLLIKRADVYRLQRVKYNTASRKKSELDERLLLDLAESCTSPYTDVLRAAQTALGSSLNALLGGGQLVVPVVLDGLRNALEGNDHTRIRGAMHTLCTTLAKTVTRHWGFAPDLIRLYVETASVVNASIQNPVSALSSPLALYGVGRVLDLPIIFDVDIVESICPTEDCSAAIKRRNAFMKDRRANVEAKKAALGLELVRKACKSHWNLALIFSAYAWNCTMRFDTLGDPEIIDFVVNGANDQHPDLRRWCFSAFMELLKAIDVRAVYGHDYRNYLTEQKTDINKFQVPVPNDDPLMTDTFLAKFESYDNVSHFVDFPYPGWLVWGKKLPAASADPKPLLYDGLDERVREQIGKVITRDWLQKCFEYLRQEPMDPSLDFRVENFVLLMKLFGLVHHGKTAATFVDVVELVKEVYSDGSDKHQHRATAEILCALLTGSIDQPKEIRDKVWKFAAPTMLAIIAGDLTPDNLSCWMACLRHIFEHKDPRRLRELTEELASFRLDMNSDAAFKESSKLKLVECIVDCAGWYFRHEKPILEDCLAHLDHPYKPVRESIGRLIANIYRTRYHESFQDVSTLLEQSKAASPTGIRPYQPSKEFTVTIRDVFARLEKWRLERTPGQQTPSSYTLGSKTVLIWLKNMLSTPQCIQLVPFFSDPFIEHLLHMMDVKEDPELMTLANDVYVDLPKIPLRAGEADAFIAELIRVGKTAAPWSWRLRTLGSIQAVYSRGLFLMQPVQRQMLFDAVGDMLADPRLEVRDRASATLAGMIRYSPASIRNPIIHEITQRFKKQLRLDPMSERQVAATDTPVDTQRQVVARHAALLGMGALIEAFMYASPAPKWMAEVLGYLATRAASDPGMVGKATRAILANFKRTRQDSWRVDQKVRSSFCPLSLLRVSHPPSRPWRFPACCV
jgi:proteasome activator subunit 4